MNTNPDVDKAMQTLRIIVGALIGGMVTFGLVAVLVGSRSPASPQLAQPLLLVVALFGLAELPAALIVRRTIIHKTRQPFERQPPTEDPTPSLLPTIMTVTIITCAMGEAFGLLGLLVFLVTGAGPALLAPAIAFVVLVFQFPTRDRVSRVVANLTGRPWY